MPCLYSPDSKLFKNEILTHTLNFGLGAAFSESLGIASSGIRVRVLVCFIKYARNAKSINILKRNDCECLRSQCSYLNEHKFKRNFNSVFIVFCSALNFEKLFHLIINNKNIKIANFERSMNETFYQFCS